MIDSSEAHYSKALLLRAKMKFLVLTLILVVSQSPITKCENFLKEFTQPNSRKLLLFPEMALSKNSPVKPPKKYSPKDEKKKKDFSKNHPGKWAPCFR